MRSSSYLKDYIKIAQDKMQQYYNKGRRDREFLVGEWVFFKHLTRGQRTLLGQPYSKLLSRYYGPYKILEGWKR